MTTSPLIVRMLNSSVAPDSVGALSVTLSSLRVSPEIVLTSIHTAVPSATPITTSPDALWMLVWPRATLPSWKSPDALVARTEPPIASMMTSPLADLRGEVPADGAAADVARRAIRVQRAIDPTELRLAGGRVPPQVAGDVFDP